jgi:hypothetical protein
MGQEKTLYILDSYVQFPENEVSVFQEQDLTFIPWS